MLSLRTYITLFLLTLGLAVSPGAFADQKHKSCDSHKHKGKKKDQQKFLDCVTVEGARAHQAALQKIADNNNGIRTSGTPGYDESVFYVRDRLQDAGYNVNIQPFGFQTFITLSPTVLENISGETPTSVPNRMMSYSGSGDVTALVSTLPGEGLEGCNATDFDGFPKGFIALISRGACTFAQKAVNAKAVNAAGVVIYNNREGVLNGTLGGTFALDISVTAVTQEIGAQLVALTPGLTLRLKTETFRGEATTFNVLAESMDGKKKSKKSKKSKKQDVVMAGAHLDSVNAGAGIQDNGSGSAAILEVAEQMGKAKVKNKVRFAWWGAEESGLLGSEYYVANLSEEDREDVALYLNFDMIGSPNHGFFIYDGDDSDEAGAGPGPEGSAQIEQTFEDYYSMVGEDYRGTDFSGRSDYGPFIAIDIPSGGLFTGAEGIKTEEEAALWGGTAGEQYDPCYHLACDNYDNINLHAYEVNVDAVAYSVMKYAMSTKSLKPKKAKKSKKSKKGKKD